MSEYMQQFQNVLKNVDSKFEGNELLTRIQAQTKLPKSYLIGFGIFYFIMIFINVGGVGEILSNFLGFCIPTYYSLKALKTASGRDDTQLLTYWIVFSFSSVIEFWSKAILYWIPFYWLFKSVFLLYIAIPSFGGAELIYTKVIAPLSNKYMPLVEGQPEKLAKKVEDAAKHAKTTGFSR